MTKILLLSTCGKLGEPEDVRYLNLFLASLKANIVPFFETKVLLFSTSIEKDVVHSETYKRVVEFELQDVVEVKSLYTMDLPEESIEFIEKAPWYERIGLHQNMLFDYSKIRNFFNAEWIFLTDTDIELLPNFFTYLEGIQSLRRLNSSIVLTLAGDSYNFFIKQNTSEFLFEAPERVNIYDTSSLDPYFNIFKVTKNDRPDLLTYENKILISPVQLKTRNDFVGISKELAEYCEFNWCVYNYSFTSNNIRNNEVDLELQKLWEKYSTPSLILRMSTDKGYAVHYKLQEGKYRDMLKIQLPTDGIMSSHYASGWLTDSFVEYSYKKIVASYPEYFNIVEKDINR